jgi:pyridoxine/pyridoxamine 5'-phosphate oxidase
MAEESSVAAKARQIVDANSYMTLATADAQGRPWASPVWFAQEDYRDFFWVSKPGARHSQNLAVRAELGIVIFDFTVPAGTGGGLYLEAVAGEVPDEDVPHGVEVFSRRSQQQGLEAFAPEDVRVPATLRLYRATASELFVLDSNDIRIRVGDDAGS